MLGIKLMTHEQNNRVVARVVYWQAILGLFVAPAIVLFQEQWSNWNAAFIGCEILLLVTLLPRIIRFERPFTDWLIRRWERRLASMKRR
jgi:hypothetical protein